MRIMISLYFIFPPKKNCSNKNNNNHYDLISPSETQNKFFTLCVTQKHTQRNSRQVWEDAEKKISIPKMQCNVAAANNQRAFFRLFNSQHWLLYCWREMREYVSVHTFTHLFIHHSHPDLLRVQKIEKISSQPRK